MTAIRHPFGAMAAITMVHADFASAVAINNGVTNIDATLSTGAVTLDLAIDADLPDGAILRVKVSQGATGRNLTLGTGFATDAADLTGVANDVDTRTFILVGGIFQPLTLWEKIVDAA